MIVPAPSDLLARPYLVLLEDLSSPRIEALRAGERFNALAVPARLLPLGSLRELNSFLLVLCADAVPTGRAQ